MSRVFFIGSQSREPEAVEKGSGSPTMANIYQEEFYIIYTHKSLITTFYNSFSLEYIISEFTTRTHKYNL